MKIRFIKKKVNQQGRKKQINKFNKKAIMIILACMLLMGILIGTIYFNNKISENFFETNTNFFGNIESIKECASMYEIFMESALKNIIILIFFWVIGLSIVGVPILIFYIIYEGFSIGFSISYIIYNLGFFKGYSFVYSSMYITTVLNIATILFLCTSAIEVTINFLGQRKDIKSEFVRHSTICIIMLILLVISSISEALSSKIFNCMVIK